jgi:murein DD-endopeptidase MepM/ murein hydrolase activator NlpD
MGLFRQWFTLVIIPNKTSRVMRLKLPKVVALGGMVFLVGAFAAGIYGLLHAWQLEREVAAYRELEGLHLEQKVALQRFSNDMETIKGQIGRLRELDYKLRVITDLEVEKPSPAVYGIGGSLDIEDELTLENVDSSNLDLITLLDKDLVRLREMANYQEESFNNLRDYLSDQRDLIERTPHRWPTRGFVSSNFGPRTDPFTGLRRVHEGVDIVSRRGTPVVAPAEGIVTYAGYDPTLGEMAVLDHGYGVITRYGHNETVLVREGQRVSRGDVIATIGSSGKSTGPHLHYEIRINDIAVNPRNYMIE